MPREYFSLYSNIIVLFVNILDVDMAFPSPHQNASRKRSFEEMNKSNEGTSCSICFGECTSTGSHRLVFPSCGHLCGKSCIEMCLMCKERVRTKNILPIYASRVQMVDTSERDRALEQLEVDRLEQKRLQVRLEQEKLAQKTTTCKRNADAEC